MNAVEKEEKVLCIKRTDLPPPWVAETAVIEMTAESFISALEAAPFHWIARSEAEADPVYKQLIPYVLLQTIDGLHTGCYRRSGTEQRLHDFWSVGIGGHINQNDCGTGEHSLSTIVKNGMEREMSEEFCSSQEESHTVFLGVINEEITAVGHVHLGLVYRVHIGDIAGIVPGEELDAFTWIETERVFQKPLELWSKLALKLSR